VSTMAATTDIAGLAGRLTETQDRERYAALISYLNSLPPGDEFRKLAELLGLLSLLGQRIPDALAELLNELRTQVTAANKYHAQVDSRLASLPDEIAAGVDIDTMANSLAESFRQQLAATGLETTANLLRNSSREITALSGQISASLKPTAQEYKSVTATISSELARLTLASEEVRRHNSQLMAQERSNNWWLFGFMMLSILLVGILAGITMEKSGTTDALVNLGTQVERIQTPAAVPATAPVVKKNRKQSSER
jgi:beta-glucosidase-like glycosyl hydrolase